MAAVDGNAMETEAAPMPQPEDERNSKNSNAEPQQHWALRWINEPNFLLAFLTGVFVWSLIQWSSTQSRITPELQDMKWDEVTTQQLGINLNTATQPQLMQIEGIGETLAQRILEYRESIGQFTSLKQLLEVPGIGEKTLKRIEPSVYLTEEQLPKVIQEEP